MIVRIKIKLIAKIIRAISRAVYINLEHDCQNVAIEMP